MRIIVRGHIISLHYYNLWGRGKHETRVENELIRGYIVKDRVTWARIGIVLGWSRIGARYLNMDPDN